MARALSNAPKVAERFITLGKDFDQKFLDKVKTLSLSPEAIVRQHDLKIGYQLGTIVPVCFVSVVFFWIVGSSDDNAAIASQFADGK